MSRALGIDLGTTNSAVAVLEGGQPTVIVNGEGDRMTASVVAFARNGERLVGRLARRQAVLKPHRTVSSARRFIGRRYPAAQSDALSFVIVAGPSDTIRFEVDGGLFAPEEISAQVLRKLGEDAARYLGEKVTDAVITVPAGFDHAQRQATWEAGALAGLNVLRLLEEPAAAALAHGLHRKPRRTILVFDLGGATFDVSLLEVGDGGFEIKATAGDANLGGEDFDRRVVEWMADEFQRHQGIDLRRDRQALQGLPEAAEEAKIDLSSRAETAVSLPFVTSDGSGPKHLETNLTRPRFDALTADLVEKCIPPFRQALAGARLSGHEIDEVVLVGGSTRIPAVQALVRRLTGRREPIGSVHPTEVVAKGAAIQAAALVAGAHGAHVAANDNFRASGIAGLRGGGEWAAGLVDAEYTRP